MARGSAVQAETAATDPPSPARSRSSAATARRRCAARAASRARDLPGKGRAARRGPAPPCCRPRPPGATRPSGCRWGSGVVQRAVARSWGGPGGRGRRGDGWCNDKQPALNLSEQAEQDRDCLSVRFFLQVLSKVLVLMASIVYSSVSPTRGGAVWQLVGLITRRSQVQILPPQPKKVIKANHLAVVGFFAFGPPE